MKFHYSKLESTICNLGYKEFKKNGKMYHRGSRGIFPRALSLSKEKEELHQIHDHSCREDDISLYSSLQGQ